MNRILIVEDTGTLGKYLEDILLRNNYEVKIAQTGEAAISLLDSISFNMVLLDLYLPDMNGREILQAIRSKYNALELPVVVLSSSKDKDLVKEILSLQANDFIRKPFEDFALLAKVNNLLNLQNLHFTNKENLSKLKDSECRLKDLNTTKDRLFTIIAHDLKNPAFTLDSLLSIIIQYAEEGNDQKVTEYLPFVKRASESVVELLENLLNWSRTQLNTINIQPKEFDLNIAIKDTISLYSSQLEQKKLKILFNPEKDFTAFGDLDMIKVVIRNLLSNAVKFSSENGTIDINIKKEHYELIISVRDTGIGIPKEKVNKLFCFKENHSTKGTIGEKGTGLGLMLANEFTNQNNGIMWVESEPGKGSTFYFTLQGYNWEK